jgi:anti-sigma factor RsiW
MKAQHLSIDELADAAEGVLDPERQAFVASHIADCAECKRITGLVSSTVGGPQALLRLYRVGDSVHVTVVTGCGDGIPAAGRQRSCRAETSLRNSEQAVTVSRLGLQPTWAHW